MKLRLIKVIAFLMSALSLKAYAGIIFVPVEGVVVDDPTLATVDIRGNGGSSSIKVLTTGISGELTEACGATGGEGDSISYTQQLQLHVDVDTGDITGIANGQLRPNEGSGANLILTYEGPVEGTAVCRPFQGHSCGQMVIHLKLNGAIGDPGNPSVVGLIRMESLGSLIKDRDSAHWAAYSSNFVLGGDTPLIELSLTSMEEGESCGV